MKTYYDIAGDGGSQILAQVQAQRRSIQASLTSVENLIAVGSGKGGVGKSTLTMALAQVLRRGGKRVAILDADFNGPCQAQMAGLEEAPWIPGEGGLLFPRRPDGLGVVSMGSFLAAARPFELDHVAKGDQFTWRATKEFSVLGQLLASMDWGELDFLLVDLPPGSERTLQYAEFLGRKADFLLVTIPSDLARGVVARSMTALNGCGEQGPATGAVLGYVENMAGYYCRGCDSIQPLFPEASERPEGLSAPCLGKVPFDPALAELCDRGWPSGSGEGLKSIEAVEQAVSALLIELEKRK